MTSPVEQANRHGAIAIVGIASELPSGEHSASNLDHEGFFRLLLEKKETYEKVPADRPEMQRWLGDGPDQINVEAGSFLKNLAGFDHTEFGVTAKDARAMAVSTRKLLQLSFLALLDSGIDYRSQEVGSFMSAVDYSVANLDGFDARGSFAGIPCMVANKVSYHLDLLGPSVPLNTACSSSLTALHLAIQALRNGDCNAALVGGCQLNHRLVEWTLNNQGSVLAHDGKCKPFNASADGFSRGEGAVVIVIKALEDAIRDKDHIYASILGTGINSCGLGGPVSAPVAEAQKLAMLHAYRGTGRHPSEVDYVEMHATGTAAGDPTEANWVGESFQRESDILVGSVKGNIGHLEIAAFLASLLKVCSMFKTGLIPPNVNLGTLNPKIKWDEYRLRVVTEVTHLSARHESGRALVSIGSSGIGGSNGHAVVEAPPARNVLPICTGKRPVLLAVGGLTVRSILALCDKVSSSVPDKTYEDLAALATVSGRRARQMGWRSIAIRNPEDSDTPVFSFPVLAPRKRPPLVFVFAGQGPQYLEMGRELFQTYPAFRESILSLDEVYKKEVGVSLVESTGLFILNKYAPELPSTWPIAIILPAMAMLQVALIDLFKSIGILPDIVIGHSAGETAMLYAADAASKELVLALAIARGRAMTMVEGANGGMAALSCSPSKAISIIVDIAGGASEGLDIACYNSPESVTIAGRNELLDQAVQSAEKQGILARKLRTNVAVHSHLMDICETQYRHLVEEAFNRYGPVTSPSKAVYSTKTGRIWRDAFTVEYYWNSARGPVHFGDAVSELLKDHPNATFIEVSPHPVLSQYLRSMSSDNNNIVLCPMERPRKPRKYHETTSFLLTVGQLLLKGYNMIDFASLNGFSKVPRTSFDSLNYPLSKKQVPYLMDSKPLDRQLVKEPAVGQPKIYKVNSQTYPDLAQHVIKGEPLMPATGFIEMSLSQGAKTIHDVQFRAMLFLSSQDPLLVKLETDGAHWSIVSNDTSGAKARKIHAEGFYSTSERNADETPEKIDIQEIIGRCVPIDAKEFYDQLRYFSDYGPLFQRVVDCYKGEGEVVARVRGSDKDLEESTNKYVVHPAILDAVLQICVHRISTGNKNEQVYFLPSGAESIVIDDVLTSKGMPNDVFTHVILKSWKPDTVSFDCTLVDSGGARLCQILGLTVLKHRSGKKTAIDHCYDIKNEKLLVEPMHVDAIAAGSLGPKDIVVHYVQGGEMQLKANLLPINRYEKHDIWILASNDINGAGARGLTRTLRREVPSWNTRLILYPTETPVEHRLSLLPHIKDQIPLEDEVVLDSTGQLFAPRVVECPPSSELLKGSNTTVRFHAEKTYVLLGGVGSLGVRVALWMYEHGARHIILTSRNGPQSKALQDTLTKRILEYLQGLSDSFVRVEKCNIASVEDMKALFQSIEQPISGCMLLATALSDRFFFSQTAESFSLPFVTKTQAFMTLKDVIDISALDFLISFSTASTFGNAGQGNYASANTALDEMIRAVPNAFSMIIPLIADSSVAEVGKMPHFSPWAISSDDLCNYLEDALLRLRKEKFWLYIPDINWNNVHKYLGPSLLYNHLIVRDDKGQGKRADNSDAPDLIRKTVMKYVEVDPEDFFPSAPLFSYGLDSLTAAQLSSDLEPFLEVTQVQLLAGITLDDILKRAKEDDGTTVKESNNAKGGFSWSGRNREGETLVKLREGEGVPLILIHGSSGDILPFKSLQDSFTTPLWAIQLTPEAPSQSLPELAKFYYETIKKFRPEGPYRLASYSGTSALAYEVAHFMESNGDTLGQIALIDHFPTLFHSPLFQIDEETAHSGGNPSRKLLADVISAISELYRRDKNPACKRIASELSDALHGDKVSPSISQIIASTEEFVAMSAKFILDLAGGEVSEIPVALRTWVRQIKAPVTLYIAREGNLKCMPESDQDTWERFRAAEWVANVDVRVIDDGHFSMLDNVEFAGDLEKHW